MTSNASSKGQLDLFGNLSNDDGVTGSRPAASADTHVSAASSSASSATSEVVASKSEPSPKASPKASSKKPKQSKAAAKKTDGLQDLYSKKDWSPPKEEKRTVVTETTTVVAKTKSTVTVPVVKATEIPYEPEENTEPSVMSVSDLNKNIREILEGRFPLLWLKGEISNFKAHTSGHFYFSLKDAKAQINAVMFRGFNQSIKFRPEDGMEVLVRGKVTVYEPRGNYQIFCEMMEPVGAGALQKAFEQLKAKLQKEGLFAPERKRPLPAHPRHIAIVTSPTGAAIRDMLNVLGRRFKGAHITVVPCKVQGDAAPGEIVEAIKLAQRLSDIDVMIVGRGGGSIEDLWAFNDERVARAIAAARVPVISAVGHEVDFTIADFVADLRAPTPSAAAELVVANAADLAHRITTMSRALTLAFRQRLAGTREQLQFLARRLIDPQRMLQDASIRCDELMQRLDLAMKRGFETRASEVKLLRARLPQPKIEKAQDTRRSFDRRLRAAVQAFLSGKKQALAKNMAVLDSLSPLKVLDRGFSMVVVDDKIVTHAEDLKVGDRVNVRMCKGSIEAEVKKVNKER
jgi:exodeoxyribonuclease VII large subunit